MVRLKEGAMEESVTTTATATGDLRPPTSLRVWGTSFSPSCSFSTCSSSTFSSHSIEVRNRTAALPASQMNQDIQGLEPDSAALPMRPVEFLAISAIILHFLGG